MSTAEVVALTQLIRCQHGEPHELRAAEICWSARLRNAEAILAAGYERRRDHVAEADELRKQVRG